ncbi:MAG: nitroreductase family protein [Bacteroidia bacterium]|nr:nitroreductase family protein [Bacteroidia bacterium]
MKKKTVMSVLLVLFSGFVILMAQTTGNNVVDVILKSYSAKVFTTIPVSDSDIDLIVKCGMKAPSGRNTQPWKFTVVKDQTITGEILQNITAGNILIIISGQEKQDGTVDPFNCALATENMYVAAQSLSLGAHIYAGPVSIINTNLKDKLGIPADYKAITVLRVGNIDKSIDAASGASARKKPEEVVNYK